MVIQIVNDNVPQKETATYSLYEQVINISDTLIIESVDYSYAELRVVRDFIEDYYRENNPIKTYAIYNNVYTPIESFGLGDTLHLFILMK